MAALSFRDRFFSPPVAHAVTSPSGILALGVGAALGILATIGTGGLAAPAIAAVVGGTVGYGGRVALAIPRKGRGTKIDPFSVDDPWRHAIRDAISAQTRYAEAVRSFRKGPTQVALGEIAGRLDEAVDECWAIAQQGQVVADARKRINDREISWQLQSIETLIKMEGGPSKVQAETLDSLRSQLATAGRMDALIASTRDELNLINARMDESVTQAIELSVSNRSDALDPLSDSVEEIVDDLETLRLAMDDLSSDDYRQAATGPDEVAAPPDLPAPPDRNAGAVPPPLPSPRPEQGPGQTWPPST